MAPARTTEAQGSGGGRDGPRRRRGSSRLDGTAIVAAILVSACGPPPPPPPGPDPAAAAQALFDRVGPGTPLGRLLDAAAEGDPMSERLVGYRLFYGEAAPLDRGAALYWFERAALRGDAPSQVNMAILHELGIGTERDRQAALRYFRLARDNPELPADLPLPSLLGVVGAACSPPDDTGGDSEVFGTFCAGCHGRLGLAAHPDAPSFALGERMEKRNEELLTTIHDGHGQMPEWSDKLPVPLMQAALRQARRLTTEFGHGTVHRVRPDPRLTLRFGDADSGQWDFGADPTGLPTDPSLTEACTAR